MSLHLPPSPPRNPASFRRVCHTFVRESNGEGSPHGHTAVHVAGMGLQAVLAIEGLEGLALRSITLDTGDTATDHQEQGLCAF
jgi:hypothetical protein